MTLYEATHGALFKLRAEVAALESCRPWYLSDEGLRYLADLRAILSERAGTGDTLGPPLRTRVKRVYRPRYGGGR